MLWLTNGTVAALFPPAFAAGMSCCDLRNGSVLRGGWSPLRRIDPRQASRRDEPVSGTGCRGGRDMGRTIVVTGGSRGIGRSSAIKAGKLGWGVAVNYRSDAAAAESVARDVIASGGRSVTVQGDVASEPDVVRLFEMAEAELGPIDGVVINAGIVAPASPIVDMSYERVRRMFDTNVMGTFLTAREAARAFRKRDRPGSIVIVSSAASRLGSAGEYVDYAASKGAADALTIGLSKELGPFKVRVNAVRPAFIDTEIHASGGRPDRAKEMGAATPLGRAGSPEEVADAILWLLSDASSYVTGSFVEMSGGR